MSYLEQLSKRHKIDDASKVGAVFSQLTEHSAKEEVGQNGRMLITAIATTAGVDLENEVVVPSGANVEYFRRYKSIYYGHNTYDLPIATLQTMKMLPDGSGWRVQAITANHQFARDVAACIAEGAINGGSIGFLRRSCGTPTTMEVEKYGPHDYITREWDWLEWSITPCPCNPDAMIESAASIKAMPESSAQIIDRLATKGIIRRESAEKMGIKRRCIVVKPMIQL